MQTEIEAKFLDVNPDDVRERLFSIGGVMTHPERLMRRKVFDFKDGRFDQKGAWLRVRDEGDKVTVSYKQQRDTTLHGTSEHVITVDDFGAACELLVQLGMVEKSYQETKRETWMVGEVEVVIDTWPWIPTFIECEGLSEDELRAVVEQLGFRMEDAVHGGVAAAVYRRYYEIPEKTVNNWPRIVFSEPAPWPKKKCCTRG